MLTRFVIASVVLLPLVQMHVKAGERDYLQRGEEKPTDEIEIKYDRAVRDVLSRAWRTDVVVRMVDTPAFKPEWAAGIARFGNHYDAFEVTASKHIWSVLGFGGGKKGDYHAVLPVIHERSVSASLAARIATLWRRVLQDIQNYGKDPGMYLDTDQFAYHVNFLPGERRTAYMTAWGPRTEQLINVAAALADYANGAPEKELVQAVRKAERRLGI